MEFKLPRDFGGVRIFSSEVSDGSMDKEGIGKNLPKFLKKNKEKICVKGTFEFHPRKPANSPAIAYSEQIHSNKIKLIKKPGYYKGCDGLLTGEKVILAVKSADCIPLLFFSKNGGFAGGTQILGALHVGRRSLTSGIISVSLREYFEKSSLSPTDVRFFIGPHIRVKNYEVGKDVADELKGGRFERFLKRNNNDTTYAKLSFEPVENFSTRSACSKNKGVLRKSCNDIYFDLTEALRSELEELHVKRENIIDSNIDTFENESFFSYRRGDRDKLFISLISWLQEKQL